MAPRPNWKPRRSVIDLYTERDKLGWQWRALGMLAASMMLLGFLLFPVSFPSTTDTIIVNQGTFSILAVILLALGYSFSVALWFICTSWLFQLDVLFLPCLFSCTLGLVNIAINIGVRPTTPFSTPSIAALSLATISTLIYGTLSFLTHLKISHARKHTGRSRSDSESHDLLPEDELQRQQLLRLLLQKESDRTSPAASTFRIDIPEYSKTVASQAGTWSTTLNEPDSTTYLAAPGSTHEPRGRSIAALPLQEQLALLRHPSTEPATIADQQAALERARARSAQSASTRSRRASSTSSRPPVIINTRHSDQDISRVPFSERHPLERGDFIRGTVPPKQEEWNRGGVHRPEDMEEDQQGEFSYSNPTPERAMAEIELERRGPSEGGGKPRVRRIDDGWR